MLLLQIVHTSEPYTVPFFCTNMLKRITRSQHTGIHRFAVFVGSKNHLSQQDCRDYTLKVRQPVLLEALGSPPPPGSPHGLRIENLPVCLVTPSTDVTTVCDVCHCDIVH